MLWSGVGRRPSGPGPLLLSPECPIPPSMYEASEWRQVSQSFYSFFFLHISVKSQEFNLVGTKGKKAGGHRFIMSWPTGHSVCEIIQARTSFRPSICPEHWRVTSSSHSWHIKQKKNKFREHADSSQNSPEPGNQSVSSANTCTKPLFWQAKALRLAVQAHTTNQGMRCKLQKRLKKKGNISRDYRVFVSQ